MSKEAQWIIDTEFRGRLTRIQWRAERRGFTWGLKAARWGGETKLGRRQEAAGEDSG